MQIWRTNLEIWRTNLLKSWTPLSPWSSFFPSLTWHITCDMLWGVNILSKFQLPSFYCLWFMIFEDLEEKAHGLNELINYEGVCRTAPANPGLLNMTVFVPRDDYIVAQEDLCLKCRHGYVANFFKVSKRRCKKVQISVEYCTFIKMCFIFFGSAICKVNVIYRYFRTPA